MAKGLAEMLEKLAEDKTPPALGVNVSDGIGAGETLS